MKSRVDLFVNYFFQISFEAQRWVLAFLSDKGDGLKIDTPRLPRVSLGSFPPFQGVGKNCISELLLYYIVYFASADNFATRVCV